VEKQLILLRQLFEENAQRHDIAIVMTDTHGIYLTRPVGDLHGVQALTEAGQPERLPVHLFALLQADTALPAIREYQIAPTIKATITPIHIQSRLEYYIWFVYTSEIVVEPRLEKLKSMITTVEELLSLESEKGWIRQQVKAVRALSNIVDQPHSPKKIYEMMELLFHAHQGIDFLGYAEKEDGIGFRVAELVHSTDKESTLLGAYFSMGEGFLGQVATTRQLGYWEHIARDPRVSFFMLNKIHPQTLFCYPIVTNRTLVGLLFGGSETESDIAEGLLHLGQAVASLMGMQQTFQSLRSDRDTYYLRMSMLMEISKTLNVVKDIKRVLFILVDLSLNLVQGPFSCVILKQAADKMNIVSRGMPRSQAEKYMKDISVRYANTTANRLNEHAFDGAGLYSFDGIQVMEFPLVYGDIFYGVLAMAVSASDDFMEYKEFMQSITVVASSAIDRIQGRLSESVWETIELLHRSIQQWNPSAYLISQVAREILTQYNKAYELPQSQGKLLEMVCLLYVFDPDVLGEILKDSIDNVGFIQLAREVRQLRVQIEKDPVENASDTAYVFSENSQLITLSLFYAEHLENSQVDPPAFFRTDLRESFAGFVAKRQVVDMEMTLYTRAAEPSTENNELKQAIKELTLLSSREQEVTALVAEGLSNREIAEKLIISEHTVKNHMTSIFNKMGVSDRSHLIAMFYQLGYTVN
jgi:DNA-binding CsgD family transcriptional regulator